MPLMRAYAGAFWAALFAAAAMAPGAALSQVARVMSVQGTAMLERTGQSPRILGVGESLEQRDTINVGRASNALLEFRDRTRVTLRPNSIFRINRYSDNERPVMDVRLIRGGMRTSSGEIAKRDPGAVRYQTNTAVLGVRGTEFDARICEEDCTSDEHAKPVQAAADIAARVLETSGAVTAMTDRNPRDVGAGAALQQHDSVLTPADGSAVLVFRDGTRIVLGPASELVIVRFDYDARAQSGHVHLKLAAGRAHVSTGHLAKIGGDAFLFETPAGMLRPHGTGFSVGADDVVVIHTWDGTVVLQTATDRVEIKRTDTVAVAVVDGKITFMAAPPPSLVDPSLPRADRISVDPATFGDPGAVERGVYVWVREGAVVVDKGAQSFVVPAGSAALASGDKVAALGTIPNFMRFDPTPLPNLPPRTRVQLPVFKAPDGSSVGLCTP
jgi:hypothetical protein